MGIESNRIGIENRIAWVDWAKTLGLVFVILMHIPFIDSAFRRYIMVSVIPFFFLISGFLFKEPKEFVPFVKKNVNMLLIPFVLYNLLAFVFFLGVAYFIRRHEFEPFLNTSINGVAYLTTSLDDAKLPCVPSWFLLGLFWIRIFLGAAFASRKLIIFLCVWLLSLIALIMSEKILPAHIDSAIYSMPYFLFGFFLKKIQSFDDVKYYFIFPLFLLSAAFFVLFSDINYPVNFNTCVFTPNFAYVYTVPIWGVIMLISFSMLLRNFKFSFVKDISDGSLLILCMHPIFLSLSYTIMKRMSIPQEGNHFIAPIVISVFSMILGYLMILVSKKYFPILLGKTKVL